MNSTNNLHNTMLCNSRFLFLVIFLFSLASCEKEKGHYDFGLDNNPPKYKKSDLIWENTDLGACLYIKNENPNERGNRSWFELQVKKNDGQIVSYVYYYINMEYGGIRNDTLLLADLKKETNDHIPNYWYFIDSARNVFTPIENDLGGIELDSKDILNNYKLLLNKSTFLLINKNKNACIKYLGCAMGFEHLILFYFYPFLTLFLFF